MHTASFFTCPLLAGDMVNFLTREMDRAIPATNIFNSLPISLKP
jgi:hypothetical protein